MAKIVDPDLLTAGTTGTEMLVLDTTAKTLKLQATGALIAKDGVSLQCIYSKLIELWTTSTYNKYPFPMYTIDAKSGQFQVGTDGSNANGWKWLDDTTRTFIRDGGWSEYNAAGTLARQYVGMIALASGYPAGAQFYYQKTSTGAPTNFTFTDAPNEGIQVYGDVGADATTTTFDNRTYFKMFCREYNYLYDDAVLSDVGETATGPYKVALPISVGADLNISSNDAGISASPYSDINIKFLPASFQYDVDTTGSPRDFGIVVDVGTHSGTDGATTAGGSVLTTALGGITGATYVGGTLKIHEGTNKGTYNISGTPTATTVTISGTFPGGVLSNQSFTLQRATPVTATLKEIYTKVQYQLRQSGDIDATTGTVTGKTANSLMYFVGSTLVCGNGSSNPNGGGSGVVIQGMSANDLNSVELYDNTVTKRLYPYAAAGTLSFNAFLTQGGTGYYRMYVSSTYGTAGAITVNDKDGNPIQGTISGASVNWSFDYDNNAQGHTAGTNLTVTVVAGNKGVAKPVVATYTITRSKGQGISLVAEQDRGYLNP